MVKTFTFIIKVMVFEGLAGCVRERKRYQTNIKHDTKIHSKIYEKSMQNVCSKSDAKNIEHHRTWSPNGIPNPLKIEKNRVRKTMRKRVGRSGGRPF